MREAHEGHVWHERCRRDAAKEVLRDSSGIGLRHRYGVVVPQHDQNGFVLVRGRAHLDHISSHMAKQCTVKVAVTGPEG